MADFSLTTVFVVPVGSGIANSGSTQDLTAGKVGFFRNDYRWGSCSSKEINTYMEKYTTGNIKCYLQINFFKVSKYIT